MKKFTYQSILPSQSNQFLVFGFCAKAKDILEFAKIDRIGRTEDGSLKGFQRPQVSNHIEEIRKYLNEDEAVLPNSVVVAFTSGIDVKKNSDGKTATITIQNDDGLKKKFYYDDKVKKYKTIKDGKWQTRTIKYGIAETPHTLTLNNNIFTTEVTFIMLNKKLNANANDKVLANVEEENYGKVGDGLEISGLEEKDIQNRGFFSLITTSDI